MLCCHALGGSSVRSVELDTEHARSNACLRLRQVADDRARDVQRVGGRRGLRRRRVDLAHQPQDMHQQLLHVERGAVVRLCSASTKKMLRLYDGSCSGHETSTGTRDFGVLRGGWGFRTQSLQERLQGLLQRMRLELGERRVEGQQLFPERVPDRDAFGAGQAVQQCLVLRRDDRGRR